MVLNPVVFFVSTTVPFSECVFVRVSTTAGEPEGTEKQVLCPAYGRQPQDTLW